MQTLKGVYLDSETEQLLTKIAEYEAEGERISESRTIRKMIREKAHNLGIVISANQHKKTRREKSVAA